MDVCGRMHAEHARGMAAKSQIRADQSRPGELLLVRCFPAAPVCAIGLVVSVCMEMHSVVTWASEGGELQPGSPSSCEPLVGL